jgi:hypothetical protein
MKDRELKKKLISYSSLAAGALAMAGQAEAAVVYSGPKNIVVDASNPIVTIDLDSNTVPDFAIFNRSYYINTTTPVQIQGHAIFGNPYNAFMINEQITTTSPPLLVVNLPNNYSVKYTLGTGRHWVFAGFLDVYYNGNSYGNFIGTTGYIGVRFNAACGTAYGWIQYSANSNATVGTIIDWAYEDTCQPIRAGDTGPQVAIPALTPAGIAVAAGLLSGAGIRALRKRKKESPKINKENK